MQILRPKKLYLPAVSIVAVVVLLLVLMSFLTLRNLDREKKTAMKFLRNQGVALMQSLEAGVRTGMATPMWGGDSMATLIRETSKDDSIAYIHLMDSSGDVVHSSDPGREGKWLGRMIDLSSKTEIATRIIPSADSGSVYELAKKFEPLFNLQNMPHHRMMAQANHHRGDILILGLKMTAVEAARRSDIQHSLIMAASLIVLGSGALFFVFVIQNYYLVNRTLKQTQDYTRQVVASMANGLLSIDRDGKITSYNDLALDFLGLNAKTVGDIRLQSLIDFQFCGIDRTLQQCDTVLEKEIKLKTREGLQLPVAISVTPIMAEAGECRGAVIVLRDLREIKRLEEKVRRSEKLAAIGELAAGVAHEIRNPLSSIRGFAQYLKHTLKDKPQEKIYAETMVSEVDRINAVINDLLSFARPMTLETEPADLTQLVKHCKRLVEADAKRRNIAVNEHLDSNLSDIRIDANQVKQAVLNLLLNALQAVSTDARVDIGAAVNSDRTELRLWVEDDGPGINPDEKEKIFEPFFTNREQGTGLGLPIVHKIVENHDGEIQVESPAPGSSRGSRFTLILPIKPPGND